MISPTASSSRVAENSSVWRSAGVSRHNAADGGQKAHVEHAIGLVEHQHLDLVQMAGSLLDQVDQTAWRCDQDVAAVLEGSGLRLVAHATHDGHGNVAGDVGDLARNLVDLLGKLARGSDDEHHGTAAVAPRASWRRDDGCRPPRSRTGLGGAMCSRLFMVGSKKAAVLPVPV